MSSRDCAGSALLLAGLEMNAGETEFSPFERIDLSLNLAPPPPPNLELRLGSPGAPQIWPRFSAEMYGGNHEDLASNPEGQGQPEVNIHAFVQSRLLHVLEPENRNMLAHYSSNTGPDAVYAEGFLLDSSIGRVADNGTRKSEEEKKDFDCNICMEVVKRPVVTTCGHLFCWPCLYQWLHVHSQRKECPVCKGSVMTDDIIPIYGKGDSPAPSRCYGEERERIPPRPQARRAHSSHRDSRIDLSNLSRTQLRNFFLERLPGGSTEPEGLAIYQSLVDRFFDVVRDRYTSNVDELAEGVSSIISRAPLHPSAAESWAFHNFIEVLSHLRVETGPTLGSGGWLSNDIDALSIGLPDFSDIYYNGPEVRPASQPELIWSDLDQLNGGSVLIAPYGFFAPQIL